MRAGLRRLLAYFFGVKPTRIEQLKQVCAISNADIRVGR